MSDATFAVGQKVEKSAGYRYPGEVRAVLTTRAEKVRYVVECTALGCEGMLHIFNGSQLRVVHNTEEG